MDILALIIGFFYGYVSVKGQFCMNSGFSNVIRNNDTTKLKSFATAILIQMLILPLVIAGMYLYEPSKHLITAIEVPPLFFLASALGGFLFGIFMYYAGGCGAGIFFKIGEKKSGAIIASIGFIAGVYLTEKGVFQFIREASQSVGQFNQQPVWKENLSLQIAILISLLSGMALFFLLKNKDAKPKGAAWGWKRTGIAIGIIGLMGWSFAILIGNPFGLAIIPGAIDILGFKYSWGLLFVLGVPLGAFWSTRHLKGQRFMIPKAGMAGRRLLGGLGLGISGSIAAGCTVGHGLTFAPLLGLGSLVATSFIFLGSGWVGYLTRK